MHGFEHRMAVGDRGRGGTGGGYNQGERRGEGKGGDERERAEGKGKGMLISSDAGAKLRGTDSFCTREGKL